MPRIKHPKSLNDFTLSLLCLLKAFEEIVKAELLGVTQGILDPLQFACRSGRVVDDVV